MEMYFVMSSLFASRAYYAFGFLTLTATVTGLTTATVTILFTYFLLCAENYHWQWRAFASSGASAVYVFAYSLVYWARMLSFSSLTGGLLYLGYSSLISLLWFVMTGKLLPVLANTMHWQILTCEQARSVLWRVGSLSIASTAL